MEDYSVIGKPIPQIHSKAAVTGKINYVQDVALPQMLYGKILRSPHAHAKILNIDISGARGLLGVKAIITAKDIPMVKYGPKEYHDEVALAIDKVRFVGDEVAAVAAIDEDTAEEALELIDVTYEELPAVVDPEEAMKPESPRVHDFIENNVVYTVTHVFGDVEKGFKESHYIREDRFETPMISPAFLGTRATVGDFNPATGHLTLYTDCTQAFVGLEITANILGIPVNQLRVLRLYSGGGFGGKSQLYAKVSLCAGLLSMRAGRPVKIVLSREEEFATSRGRDHLITYFKSGVKKDGTLVAMQCKHIANTGAYVDIGPATTRQNVGIFDLLLRCPNVRFDGQVVYTNTMPSGTVRGLTNPPLGFGQHSHMDMIARDLGMDVVDFYLKNARQKGDITPSKYKVDSCGLSECIQEVVKASGWKEKRGKLPKNRGIGFAVSGHTCGYRLGGGRPDISSTLVMVDLLGKVRVLSGRAEAGMGSSTMVVMCVAEELGLPVEEISINEVVDTNIVPYECGNYGSRGMVQQGNAAIAAARDLRRQLFELLAEKWGVRVNELEAKNSRIYVKKDSNKGMSFKEAVRAYREAGKVLPLIGRGHYEPPTEEMDVLTGEGNLSIAYGFGAQIIEVEVDPETGKVKVLSAVAANDCGKVVNPLVLDGQSQGGIVMGIGMGLLEGIQYDERGDLLTDSFLDYRIPTVYESPKNMKHIWVETIDPHCPYGAKGITETVSMPPAPAIANAIYDAIGVRINDLPMTPEKILDALKAKKKV
jgi:4-hydroxybenzoyl-CoA reductase subunit alpha